MFNFEADTTVLEPKLDPEITAQQYLKKQLVIQAGQCNPDNVHYFRAWGADITEAEDGGLQLYNASEGHWDPFPDDYMIVSGINNEYYRVGAGRFLNGVTEVVRSRRHPIGVYVKRPGLIVDAMRFNGKNLGAISAWGAPVNQGSDGSYYLNCPEINHADPLKPRDWVVYSSPKEGSQEFYRILGGNFGNTVDPLRLVMSSLQAKSTA